MTRPFALRAALACALFAPAPALAQSKWAKHYHERVKQFERENKALEAGKRYVVLLGSSSMEGWKYSRRVTRFLSGVPALNRGISADTIGRGKRGILNRLKPSAIDCQPSHIFLMNGRNDLGRSASPPVAATARVYEQVVTQLQTKLPNTVVCIVTCPPVNKGYKVMKPHLARLNAKYREIAKRRGCPLIDLHALLKGPDGLLPLTVTRDGLHFLDKGYEVLGREIKRVLREHPRRKKAPKASEKAPGASEKKPAEKTPKQPTTRQSAIPPECPNTGGSRSAVGVLEELSTGR